MKHADQSNAALKPGKLTQPLSVRIQTTLKKMGRQWQIQFMALVAAPEGVKTFTELHPDVEVYVAALDDHLDENAYIVPGLGDAGDRIFGTK